MEPADALARQRRYFGSGATRSLAFRRQQLDRLAAALDRHESALFEALHSDLGKSPFQALASELGLVKAELAQARKRLRKWTAPRRLRVPPLAWPARAWVQPEPYGVALILSPWNYPVALLLIPLVSAIAAGNCAILKPSELASRTAAALAAMVQASFEPEYIAMITGGAGVAEKLLAERFDKIFFTGSTRVGRLVMAAAARHLTPVTLELGGKCAAIVGADAPPRSAARRIAWGKFLNAGQTCIAPDFVLVDRSLQHDFLLALHSAIREFYGPEPRKSTDYGRIVNAAHFQRLEAFLQDGGTVTGGERDPAARYFGPTILTNVPPDAAVLREEIFGPILPVLAYDDLEDALARCRDLPTPLAFYVFTQNRLMERRILEAVPSGGACVNDVVSHSVGPHLPFGGLGESGFGSYHGRAGFDAFSHSRTILRRPPRFDTGLRYPPPKISLGTLRRLLGFLLG